MNVKLHESDLPGHMQEAGYERQAWKVENGLVIVDQEIELGTVDEVLLSDPHDIQDFVEAWLNEHVRKGGITRNV